MWNSQLLSTIQCTLFNPETMTSTTLKRRTEQLIREIDNHSHKAELLELMYQQLQDDTDKIAYDSYHA